MTAFKTISFGWFCYTIKLQALESTSLDTIQQAYKDTSVLIGHC